MPRRLFAGLAEALATGEVLLQEADQLHLQGHTHYTHLAWSKFLYYMNVMGHAQCIWLQG